MISCMKNTKKTLAVYSVTFFLCNFLAFHAKNPVDLTRFCHRISHLSECEIYSKSIDMIIRPESEPALRHPDTRLGPSLNAVRLACPKTLVSSTTIVQFKPVPLFVERNDNFIEYGSTQSVFNKKLKRCAGKWRSVALEFTVGIWPKYGFVA